MSNTLELQAEASILDPLENETLPVCLPPWAENPYRPVTLWDIVTQISGEKWFWSGVALENLISDCLFGAVPGGVGIPIASLHDPVSAEIKAKASGWLSEVQAQCAKIGLAVSSETALEIKEALARENPPDWASLREKLISLRDMIRKEMKTKVFFYVTPERLRFWITPKDPFPLGKEAHEAFQSAEYDAAEAGMCLAVTRYTASVFHSMRVLEVGLSTLGKVFGISLEHTTWGPAIDGIEARIRNMHKDPAWDLPDRRAQQEFYAQAASHFGILKEAWRNYTAHKRGTYTEEQATLIFENVRAFMGMLATRLHE